jgi:hypothetical protein
MSTINNPYDDTALGGRAISRDEARDVLGQVMGLVAVAAGSGVGRSTDSGLGTPQLGRRPCGRAVYAARTAS